jgi:hypothetical protein
MKTAVLDLQVKTAHTTLLVYGPSAHPAVSTPLQTTAETSTCALYNLLMEEFAYARTTHFSQGYTSLEAKSFR